MVDLARKNLLHDRLRFAITVSGVAFAVTLVLVQVGLFVGILGFSTVTIEKLPADLWITSKNTPNIDFAHTFPESYRDRIRSIPGVERADNLIVWFMNVTLPTGAQEASVVYALEDFAEWGFPWNLVEGNLDDLRRGSTVMLDVSAEKRFGPFRPGDRREYVSERLEIIGRTKDARSFTTTPMSFLDYRLAQRLVPSELAGRTTYVLVRLAPGADLEAVRAEIARRLPFNDVYTKAEWAERTRTYWLESTGLGLNMFLTVFLGCLVGIVVVAQTLYTSTMEHLREFGTVKAIGGSNADIYAILARQATIAAVLGFAVGALISRALVPLVEKIDLRLVLEPHLVALVFVGTLVFCLAAAMISFHKVAKIDPALVFRT